MSVSVIDTITAATIEPGDFIRTLTDEIEVEEVEDTGDRIYVIGYSVFRGEKTVQPLDPFAVVSVLGTVAEEI